MTKMMIEDPATGGDPSGRPLGSTHFELMMVAALIAQADDLAAGSIEFAQGIDHATSGETLGRIMRATMGENAGPYAAVRAAVQRRVDDLGGAGQALGLFMLAADMATTEALVRDDLTVQQRSELRALWNDLRSRRLS